MQSLSAAALSHPASSIRWRRDWMKSFSGGVRNPFRLASIAAINDLYVGDVGRAREKEVDVARHLHHRQQQQLPTSADLILKDADNTSYSQTRRAAQTPIGEYTHSGIDIRADSSIAPSPQLAGKYVFGELGSTNARLFYHMVLAGGIIHVSIRLRGSAPLVEDRMDGLGEDQSATLRAGEWEYC